MRKNGNCWTIAPSYSHMQPKPTRTMSSEVIEAPSLLTTTNTMRAYYFDNIPGDQRLPHDYVPSRPVSKETLDKLNVKSWRIPVEGYEPKIDALALEQGYKNRDIINVSKEGLGDVGAPVL